MTFDFCTFTVHNWPLVDNRNVGLNSVWNELDMTGAAVPSSWRDNMKIKILRKINYTFRLGEMTDP